jgi:multiple sugar transport system ATP-binding protein
VASVSLKSVVKSYGPELEPTLKGIDLEIVDGEFFILLGPSGCGKSTLLRTIAGLETVTAGEVHIGGSRVDTLPPKSRDIAMVFQSYALYPHMTVRENMSFGLKMRKTPKAEIERRIAEIAPTLGLDVLLDRLPKALSGGQRQRVALGRAIVREPKAFLLDEPLSNLDAKLRGAMRVELKRIHQRLGVTMIYVTHDQVEAMTLGDRIAVLDQGVLQQVGPPLEVYDRPANRFVASFLGSPPMNFLSAPVTAEGFRLADDYVLPTPAHLEGAAPEGQEVQVGIRPEDVDVSLDGDGLKAVIAVSEPLGAETLLTLDTDRGAVVARVAPTFRPAVGDTVRVRPRAEMTHLFAVDSGDRIGSAPGPSVAAPVPSEAAPEAETTPDAEPDASKEADA